MSCFYGVKFDAFLCTMRYKNAKETNSDDSHCAFAMCSECNAVKCYLKYRSRLFKKQEEELVEEKKMLEKRKKPITIKDKQGRTIINIGRRKRKELSLGESDKPIEKNKEPQINPYILDRFIKTYEIITENNIKSYEELLRFIQYKNKQSIFIYIRDNRKGLEILFKNNPLQE